MAFNLTGTYVDLYSSINTAINIDTFSFMFVPTFLLCILCIMIQLYAEEVNWIMRVFIMVVFAFLIFGLLPIARVFFGDDGSILCRIILGLAIVSSLLKFSVMALYAIEVLLLLEPKKLK